MPRDFEILLLDLGWASQAMAVNSGNDDGSELGPLCKFAESKERPLEHHVLMSLLYVLMKQANELSHAHASERTAIMAEERTSEWGEKAYRYQAWIQRAAGFSNFIGYGQV